MTNLLTIHPTSSASARLSAIPLTRPLPQPPHLVAPGQASLGDFIGVFGGITYRPDLGLEPQTIIEVVYKQGLLGAENRFIDELSDADAATFKQVTAIPFGGVDHHTIVRQAKMVEEKGPYQIHLVQFSDAIIYAHPRWFQGIPGQRPDLDPQRPLLIMMEGVCSTEEASRCLEKTKKYMKIFKKALPAKVRAALNPRLELPRPEDFLVNGDADYTFVR